MPTIKQANWTVGSRVVAIKWIADRDLRIRRHSCDRERVSALSSS